MENRAGRQFLYTEFDESLSSAIAVTAVRVLVSAVRVSGLAVASAVCSKLKDAVQVA
jgi:hypothetical protein